MKVTIEKIDELLGKVTEIENSVKIFFDKVQVKYDPLPSNVIGWSDYRWIQPTGEILDAQIKSLELYEEWYSLSNTIVSKLYPDRKADLNDMYEKNKSILELKEKIWDTDKSKFQNNFLRNLSKQKSILSSTKELVDENSDDVDTTTLTEYNLPSLYQHMYIDLKSQIAVLSHQFSRYESDIKDLSQKIEGIGRITINNINQNTAKTGDITINEYIIKGMKQDLDAELKDLKSKAETIEDDEQKKIIVDLIKDVLDEGSPKVEWLKDKLSKLKYWGSKAGLVIIKLKNFADLLGIS